MANPYAVLGIRPTATPEEVKAAFRKKAMRFHPDRTGGDVDAAARMAEVNAAYDALKNVAVEAYEPPPNPTSYLRLMREPERAALEKTAQKALRKASVARRLARLTAPMAKRTALPEVLMLSAVQIEDDGARLTFDGRIGRTPPILVLPELIYKGSGVLEVSVRAPVTFDLPLRDVKGDTVRVKDPAPFITGFDGKLELHFDG